MRIKRWLTLAVAGIALLGLGLALLDRHLIGLMDDAMELLANQLGGFPLWVFGVVCTVLGLFMTVQGIRMGVNSIMTVLRPERSQHLVEEIYQRRSLQRGPRIVVIGGGTGLSSLLKGLKEYTSNITAIVAVTDDGGSSGRLRDNLGILPPGDIRNCVVALADRETLMEEVLQYRFTTGELAGHNLGNLLLAGLNNVSGGFDGAVQALSKVLAIRGQVLPSTLENVVLGAELADNSVTYGECNISSSGCKIKRVFLKPAVCSPMPEALAAIQEADAIILGPGSLYTSVIPNLLVQGVADAIKESSAHKIYICNIMTQPGETRGYSAYNHLMSIFEHVGPVVEHILVNSEPIPGRLLKKYREQGAEPVRILPEEITALGVKIWAKYLVQQTNVVRHQPEKLARAIMDIVDSNKLAALERAPMKIYQPSRKNKGI
ncbi:uridine diphosphate-N-acetylglucosamine-binding protein YvcK [Desulforamulus aquiferis]|uniref:Putative gluconeogenesis factor n=2 Tax=Desulforamulus aquiferis TaxID=1397668 RepID=A0AAW7ZEV7_9FIRM|nr:uridine diphosphate-N-acetylglucosamine-binding protein YvcK [Desulforamulus aquiferis]